MKSFNKVIKVEVSVDAIAQSMYEKLNGNFPHSELLVESIIATSSNHQLSLIYNALNGYSPDVNFGVGDIIVPGTLNAYGYWDNNFEKASNKDVASAEIIEIDPYAEDKLKVKYYVPDSTGEMKEKTTWIKHTNVTLIVMEEYAGDTIARVIDQV